MAAAMTSNAAAFPPSFCSRLARTLMCPRNRECSSIVHALIATALIGR
jgi:hypothetical protein